LPGFLFLHISVSKVVGNPLISEHDLVELLNNSSDSLGLAESFVKGHWFVLVEGILLIEDL
jgi:hypothetical protein